MLEFAKKYGGGEYSQFGEAGIIDEILKRIGLKSGTSIEFGAPSMTYCSNTFHLPAGWNKLYYDMNSNEPGIIQKTITPENVNDFPDCQVWSCDCDGPDYELWQAYKGRPDVVVIEINSSLQPDQMYYSRDKGASYATMAALAIAKGYFVVCHTGNIIAVLDKHRALFPEIVGDGIKNWVDYFNTSHL